MHRLFITEIFALPESPVQPLVVFIPTLGKRLWPLLLVVGHSHPIIEPSVDHGGLALTPNPVINTAEPCHQKCNSALDEKEFLRQLFLADFFESTYKKKSELDSKLVLGDGKLMNCPRVSKDLAQNSGYQAGWFLLVTVFWALCNSCLLLWCQRVLYEADECLLQKA